MRRLNALLVFYMLFIFGCISQSDFEKLKFENECLKKRILELEADKANLSEKYNALVVEKKLIESQTKEKKFYSESQALQYLEDYYSFFRRNYTYRDPVIRRSTDNTFLISLEESEKINAEPNKEQWMAVLWSLKINANGTYSFE